MLVTVFSYDFFGKIGIIFDVFSVKRRGNGYIVAVYFYFEVKLFKRFDYNVFRNGYTENAVYLRNLCFDDFLFGFFEYNILSVFRDFAYFKLVYKMKSALNADFCRINVYALFVSRR